MAGWLKVGILIFTVGAVLELILAAIALAQIEEPSSWTWSTLTFVAMVLLAIGLLTIYAGRRSR